MSSLLAIQGGSPFAQNILSNTNDMDVIAKESGLDWTIESSPLMYSTDDGTMLKDLSKKVLFRSDSHKLLGTVGKNFKVVQPRQILEFYGKLSNRLNVNLDAAGYVRNGSVLWGLADLGEHFRVMGQDKIRNYLMFSTANDGTRATQIYFISRRLVCNNMLNFAFREGTHSPYFVSIPHFKEITDNMYDDIVEEVVCGVNVHWKTFEKNAKKMAHQDMAFDDAVQFFINLFSVTDPDGNVYLPDRNKNSVERVLQVYENGVGQEVRSAKNTLWGAVNAVTRFVDHEVNYRNNQSKIQSSQFGTGNVLKNKGYKQALELIAA